MSSAPLPTRDEIIRLRKLQRQKSAIGKRLRLVEKELDPIHDKVKAAIDEHGGSEREIAVGRFRVRAKDGNRFPSWSKLFVLYQGAAKAKEIADATLPCVLLEVSTV